MKPFDCWIEEDDLASKRQGWILTNDSSGLVTIARLDDPGACKCVNCAKPKFKDDDEARQTVLALAMGGDSRALMAIWLQGHPVDKEMDGLPPADCYSNARGQKAKTVMSRAAKKSNIRIQKAINQEGGHLYVTLLVPIYAQKDFELGHYQPWFIGSVSDNSLDNDVIQAKYQDYLSETDDDGDDGLEGFMAWLEQQGYVGLDTCCNLDVATILPPN